MRTAGGVRGATQSTEQMDGRPQCPGRGGRRRRPAHGRSRVRRHRQPGDQRRLRVRQHVRLELSGHRERRDEPGALRVIRAVRRADQQRRRSVHADDRRPAEFGLHAVRLRRGQLRVHRRHRHRDHGHEHVDARCHVLQPALGHLHHRREHHQCHDLPARLVRTTHLLRRRRDPHRSRRQRHGALRADRPERHRHHGILGVAGLVGRVRHGHRLQRVPQRRQGRDHVVDLVHRQRPVGVDRLRLHRDRLQQCGRVRSVRFGLRDDRGIRRWRWGRRRWWAVEVGPDCRRTS